MAKIITDVKIYECTPCKDGKVRMVTDGFIENEPIDVLTFKNVRDQQINVGMTQRVQDLIGLPFELFRDVSLIIKDKQKQERNAIINADMYMKVVLLIGAIDDSIHKAGVFRRLKYLFGGKLIDARNLLKAMVEEK